MITLHQLNKVTTQKKKRVGRGDGSNRGKNAGRGHKGQVKRAGKSPVHFEGGMTSLMKRSPKKKGFSIHKRDNVTMTLTLGRINSYFEDKDTVSLESLKAKGLIDQKTKKVRVVNSGDYTKKLTFADESGLYLTKGVQDVIG
jgi:large subunit ribosomal protein L15